MTTTKPPLSHGLANALATDYFFLREQLSEPQLAVLQRVRAFVEDEVLPVINDYWEGRGALAADQADGRTRDRRRGRSRLRLSRPGHDLVRAGDDGAQPWRRRHRDGARRAVRVGDELDLDAWLRGAQAALAAADGPDGEARGVRADRARPWLGLSDARDDGAPRRRRICHQWRQTLDRKCQPRRRRGHVGARRGRPCRRLPDRERHARLPGRGDRGQGSLRASGRPISPSTVCVFPAENRLPGARSFKDAARVLAGTRSASPGPLSATRSRPTTSRSRTPSAACSSASRCALPAYPGPLANMLAERHQHAVVCLQIGRLAERASSATRSPRWPSSTTPRRRAKICADARDMLGGNGILLDYHVIRHMADIEAVLTYEGTATIQIADRRARHHRRVGLRLATGAPAP